MPTDKRSTTYRLSEAARLLLEQLAELHGISQTAVLEMAIRELARRNHNWAESRQGEPAVKPSAAKRSTSNADEPAASTRAEGKAAGKKRKGK